MSIPTRESPRVLVAAGAERQPALLELFGREPLAAWNPLAADSFAHARFLLQHQPCALMVVSSDLIQDETHQSLAWLAFQKQTPVVLVGNDQPELFARAYAVGVTACLPISMAHAHPPLLHCVMQQVQQAWEIKTVHARQQRQLAESCRHIDRLVQMIWRITPHQDDHWYSQRHMLERLQEELARSQRHQLPLSLAVGELQPATGDGAPCVLDWAAESIVRGKRRCDVVGQYGRDGFMLLMVHTPKPGGVTCCKRLQDHLEHPAQELAAPHRLIRSFFGIASMAGEECSTQSLLRVAEQNLDMARANDESRIVAV
jgi:diguanylate cyclase (GGDEF)-like protein